MKPRRLIWIVLGVTGVLQAMLIVSGYNSYFQEFEPNIGPSGPLDVQLHGDLYPAIGWMIIVAIGAVIVASTVMRFYEALTAVAIGVFFIGALFQADLPYAQAQLWGWGAGAALVAIGLLFAGSQLGIYKRRASPASPVGIRDHERLRD